jgi:hypothetical protein
MEATLRELDTQDSTDLRDPIQEIREEISRLRREVSELRCEAGYWKQRPACGLEMVLAGGGGLR